MESPGTASRPDEGPAGWFTGSVYIDAVATPAGPSRLSAAASTSHRAHAPRGTPTTARRSSSSRASVALATPRRPGRVIRPGDRVFFEPGEEHWHGAAPDRFLTHIAMLRSDDDAAALPGVSTSQTRSIPPACV
jgi:hypothetical protein